jgi:hypothetical protein
MAIRRLWACVKPMLKGVLSFRERKNQRNPREIATLIAKLILAVIPCNFGHHMKAEIKTPKLQSWDIFSTARSSCDFALPPHHCNVCMLNGRTWGQFWDRQRKSVKQLN